MVESDGDIPKDFRLEHCSERCRPFSRAETESHMGNYLEDGYIIKLFIDSAKQRCDFRAGLCRRRSIRRKNRGEEIKPLYLRTQRNE